MGTEVAQRYDRLASIEEIWDAGGCYHKVAKLRLEVIDGHDAGTSRVFGRERIVIGSHDSADFVVRDSTVSRMHCELVPESNRVVIRDLESKNGTVIHGILVREVTLTGSAILELGHTKIQMTLSGDLARLSLYDGERLGEMVGRSGATRRAFALAETAAASEAAVLIEGEAGTGKNTLAATIHERSARATQPMRVLACDATPRELLERELFGHEQGLAGRPRPGVFEAAAGGSVVLDKVGDLPIELQPRLLGVLERREVRRLGGALAIPVDVRVIATTSRNLAGGINGHRFRSDLHARLSAIQIALPPLRSRLADLPLLVADLATRLRLGADDRAWLLAPLMISELGTHQWPGNLRELRGYLEGCIATRTPAVIEALGTDPSAVTVDTTRPFHAARDAWIEAFDRGYATELLRRHRGDIATAAQAAGLDELALYHLLWRLGSR